MNNYSIHSAKTGETLIASIALPSDRIENLSSDSAEGFFQASSLDELSDLGDVTVYAILH